MQAVENQPQKAVLGQGVQIYDVRSIRTSSSGKTEKNQAKEQSGNRMQRSQKVPSQF